MLNSSAGFRPLYMPYECVRFSGDSGAIGFSCKGSFDEKVFWLQKGSVQFQIRDEKIGMKAGDMLVVPPELDFSVSDTDSEASELSVIRIDPSQLGYPVYTPELKSICREAARQKIDLLISAEEAEENGLTSIAAKCFGETEALRYGWETMVLSLTRQLNLTIIRLWQRRGLKISGNHFEEDPMYEITTYIHQHVQDGLRVEELASRCNLSYPWFAKKFREIYGISCKEYIERVRVSRVEAYLCYTDWDLTEISRITGYADCSHMIKNFKRLKQTTPGQFRMSRRMKF